MRERTILLAIGFVMPLCLAAQGLDDIIAMLRNASPYSAHAHFETSYAQAGAPVAYEVGLMSETTPEDTLSPCRYLIEWSSITAAGDSVTGFNAYHDGHFYTYREGELMQESHASRQPWQFAPGGDASRGVQARALFASLLPQYMAENLADLSRPTARVTCGSVDGSDCVIVTGSVERGGYTASTLQCALDAATFRPRLWRQVSNPDAASEQTTEARFTYPGAPSVPALDEEGLSARHPEAFGPLRASTFTVENLAGRPLPSFSCRIFGDEGQRMTHRAGEPLDGATLLVFLSPCTDDQAETMAAIRAALGESGSAPRLLWVFPSSAKEEYLADADPNREAALVYARSLGTACGVKEYPSLVLAGSDGRVKEIAPGVNREQLNVVIKKMTNTNIR